MKADTSITASITNTRTFIIKNFKQDHVSEGFKF